MTNTEIQVYQGTTSELEIISGLVREVFQESIAPLTSEFGVQSFHEISHPDKMRDRLEKGAILCGIVNNGKLLGVFELNNNHLLLLFIRSIHQGNGLGKIAISWMIEHITSNSDSNSLTVQSAPKSVLFYEKQGFITTGPLIESDGIPCVPLELTIIRG